MPEQRVLRPHQTFLNLLVVFSLIIEVRKPSQLAGLIRVIPKLRGTVSQSMPLFVSLCSYLSKSPVGTSSLWLYSHVLGL